MKFRTKIIGNRIVNSVEQLARYLKDGDIFLRPRNSTQFRFEKFEPEENTVICENLDTHTYDRIFSNSPVFKLTYL